MLEFAVKAYPIDPHKNSLTRFAVGTEAANINVGIAANFTEYDKEIAAAFGPSARDG
ncbi:hypothetical protein [Bradyrhizobium sp. USDA 4506]